MERASPLAPPAASGMRDRWKPSGRWTARCPFTTSECPLLRVLPGDSRAPAHDRDTLTGSWHPRHDRVKSHPLGSGAVHSAWRGIRGRLAMIESVLRTLGLSDSNDGVRGSALARSPGGPEA